MTLMITKTSEMTPRAGDDRAQRDRQADLGVRRGRDGAAPIAANAVMNSTMSVKP